MKVGDLVKHAPSGTVGLIVADRPGLLVQWCDDIREVEDIDNYEGELEIINESR
jgi:hypothetical protein